MVSGSSSSQSPTKFNIAFWSQTTVLCIYKSLNTECVPIGISIPGWCLFTVEINDIIAVVIYFITNRLLQEIAHLDLYHHSPPDFLYNHHRPCHMGFIFGKFRFRSGVYTLNTSTEKTNNRLHIIAFCIVNPLRYLQR